MHEYPELSNDPDLRGGMAALRRVAEDARKQTVRTGTRLVVVEAGERAVRKGNPLDQDAASQKMRK